MLGFLGAMAPGLMSAAGDIFGSNQLGDQQNMPNAANAAMPYLNQIPSTMSPYYSPYINAGRGALNNLQGQYGQLTGNLGALNQQYGSLTGMLPGIQQQLGSTAAMLPGLQNQYQQMFSDPAAAMNKIGSQFQQSPGYQFQVDQAMNAANRAAAAGGMLGTPQQQQNIAGTVNNLANQDYYNYLSRAMGLQQTGLSGASNLYGQGLASQLGLYNTGLSGQQNLYGMGLQGQQGMAGMGYGASSDLATSLANALQSQAQLGYAGQANQNMANYGSMGAQAGLTGSAFSNLGQSLAAPQARNDLLRMFGMG